MKSYILATLATYLCAASAQSILDINGPAWLSPYDGQTLYNVSGLVTAVGPSGFFLRDTSSPSAKGKAKSPGSNAIYVYGSAAAKTVASGDIVTIGNSKVAEYRSSPAYIYLTELMYPTDVLVKSSGNKVTPVVVGKKGLQPPREQFAAGDNKNIYSLPGGSTLISITNSTLAPTKYGLDFWESLSGQLVSITGPVALGPNSNYGDVWVRGDWKVSGLNKAGGLTITHGKKTFDANPETILIGDPLDGTKNAKTKMGDVLEPVEGVVTYAFGFYRILPKTGLKLKSARTEVQDPTKITSKGTCKGLSVGQYNVENLTPTSSHLSKIADHIATYMGSPDLVFLQEVMDNDGTKNTGIVSGEETLKALSAAVASISGIQYSYAEIAPSDGLDGGAPGGNIRVAYFYNPAVLSLNGTPGNATTAVQVLKGPVLSVNPGRVDPTNVAFTASRKPLVAAFTVKGTKKPLFVANVHSGSKGGSTSLHGDSRPPINGGVEDRLAQAETLATFFKAILKEDKKAHIIAAGDFNEFSGVAPQQVFDDILYNADEVAGIKEEERYSYNYDMNSQQLDHTLISAGLKKGLKKYEHLHLNTWAAVEVSDHDPSVMLVDAC